MDGGAADERVGAVRPFRITPANDQRLEDDLLRANAAMRTAVSGFRAAVQKGRA